jgi:hypothetical protein
MAKKQIVAGLNALVNTANNNTPAQEPTEATVKGDKKVVSFSVGSETDEKLRYIAYYDRKTISAVINEALDAYFKTWTPAPQERPRKL